MRKGTIYIAGPMRGFEAYNFPAFDFAAAALKADGWNVISPASMDRAIGFDPEIDEPDHDFLIDAMRRDVHVIIEECDAMAMLPGWHNSTGAKAEYWLARWKHIPIYDWPTMELIENK